MLQILEDFAERPRRSFYKERYGLSAPIGATMTPSGRVYAYSPDATMTIRNAGGLIFVVSIFAASLNNVPSPAEMSVSPPSFISTSPYGFRGDFAGRDPD